MENDEVKALTVNDSDDRPGVDCAVDFESLAGTINLPYIKCMRIDLNEKTFSVTYINKVEKHFDFFLALSLLAHIAHGMKLAHGGFSGPAIIIK